MSTAQEITTQVTTYIAAYPRLGEIITAITESKGVPYLVGGTVRDMILGRPTKDIDIEVHKLPLEALENLLGKFGVVRLVGKQFGVLRIDGLDIDFSLPRTDSAGRKPQVELHPEMSIEDACRRRDVTMNAMAIDLTPYAVGKMPQKVMVLDPYGGRADLAAGRMRAVDAKLFVEDPLRFYRVMQFVARFEVQPDEQLGELCKTIDLSGVAKERIAGEITKMLQKSRRPSLGITWLRDISRLQEIMPEVHATIDVIQPVEHHPEGDVFEHTLQSLDAAAQLEFEVTSKERIILCWAALCHDLGKAVVTDDEGRAHGHDEAGVPLTRALMKRFTGNVTLITSVEKLVHYHLAPGAFLKEGAGPKAYKRLAKKLAPEVNMRLLGKLSLCDHRGRNPDGNEPLKNGQELIELFWSKVQEAAVETGPEAPVLQGRDLLEVMEPGPKMGELLDKAYEIQIEEGIRDLEQLKKRVLES